jgi:hypothetical protein
MTIVSNDPAWWPAINSNQVFSYFLVSTFVAVTYDWALTFSQEVELIWRQRWSLMTILYLSVRYLGIIFTALYILDNVPTISLTGTECWIMDAVCIWMYIVVVAMLCVIMIARLHAMYQRSRKILMFLIVIFLTVNIFGIVGAVMTTMHASWEEIILSGTYMCSVNFAEDTILLGSITWILGTVWEVLALCLAVWIAVKHFRELRPHSAGGIIGVMGDCFRVMMKTHMLYFTSFIAVSCFHIMLYLSPPLSEGYSLGRVISNGLCQIFEIMQMFVLGPRLILSIREYHAELVASSDSATAMTSIAFQEHVQISTGSSV